MNKATEDPFTTDMLNVRLETSTRDLSGTVLGDFLIERPIGQGGMGKVYLARQISLNRPVAIKVLRPDLVANPTVMARFEAEAWAAAKLNHPNIVHIYAFSTTDDVRYIAMEYVEGTNLREYIGKKQKQIELPLALSIMRQAGLAVGAAGEIGLLHRDIKPENLLLTRKGLVKVADFGLSRDLEEAKQHLTQPGMTMGTPLYMSPEQVQGHALDHRSDLYSLGVTFYHMLAGTPPFSGETSLAIALKHVKDSPVSLAVHRPELPPELVELVAKLMQKKPADRYQTAAEMLRDLGKIREKLAIAATTHTGSLPSTVTGASPVLAEKRRISSSAAWKVLAGLFKMSPRKRTLLMIFAVAIGGLVGWMNRQEDLLSPEAPIETAPPGLWIVPDWANQTPRMATAEQQYHYAQIVSTNESREAAWLAVPGYFRAKTDHAWWIKSYCQLARDLLAKRDANSLEILGKEISRLGHPDDELLVVLLASTRWVFDGSPSDVARELAPFASSTLQPTSINSSFIPLLLDIVRSALEIRVDDDTNIHNSLKSLENRYSGQFPWERLNRRGLAPLRRRLSR